MLRAAEACRRSGRTQYTPATGLPRLRERVAAWYGTHFGVEAEAGCIVVTAGASAALHLVCLGWFELGDDVLMPNPGDPCDRHFVAATGATPRRLPTTAAGRYQPGVASVAAHWVPATRGVLPASPSNPTGTSIARTEMAAIAGVVRDRGGVTRVDEIGLGLSYDEAYGRTAPDLGHGIVSINSFSKYFGTTNAKRSGSSQQPERS